MPLHALTNLIKQVINLAAHRTYVNLGIQETRRANNLLHVVLTYPQLVITRRGADIDKLRNTRFKFVKAKWTVVESRRQTKTMLHKRHLTRAVAFVHTTNLRYRHMALVDDAKHVFGEIVD